MRRVVLLSVVNLRCVRCEGLFCYIDLSHGGYFISLTCIYTICIKNNSIYCQQLFKSDLCLKRNNSDSSQNSFNSLEYRDNTPF